MGKMRTSIAAALLVIGSLAGRAHAGPVFSMTDLVGSSAAPTPPTIFVPASAGVLLSDFSEINFVTASATNQNAALPGDTITIGTILFSPSPTSSTPTSFDLLFDYKVTLTDTASTQSGAFDLTGELTGAETANPTSITSTFHNLTLSTNLLTLGGNPYSIALGPVAGPTGNGNGTVDLIVTVPEPATLGIALLASGLLLKRKRQE